MKNKMTWLDLYNFLYERANDINNLGKFPWNENVEVFDFETLDYYSTDFVIMPDNKVSFSIDTTQTMEEINGSRN